MFEKPVRPHLRDGWVPIFGRLVLWAGSDLKLKPEKYRETMIVTNHSATCFKFPRLSTLEAPCQTQGCKDEKKAWKNPSNCICTINHKKPPSPSKSTEGTCTTPSWSVQFHQETISGMLSAHPSPNKSLKVRGHQLGLCLSFCKKKLKNQQRPHWLRNS